MRVATVLGDVALKSLLQVKQGNVIFQKNINIIYKIVQRTNIFTSLTV